MPAGSGGPVDPAQLPKRVIQKLF